MSELRPIFATFDGVIDEWDSVFSCCFGELRATAAGDGSIGVRVLDGQSTYLSREQAAALGAFATSAAAGAKAKPPIAQPDVLTAARRWIETWERYSRCEAHDFDVDEAEAALRAAVAATRDGS